MTPGGDHDLSRLAKAQNPGGVCARSPCMANPSGTGGRGRRSARRITCMDRSVERPVNASLARPG